MRSVILTKFTSYCKECKKETIHIVADSKPGFGSIGLQGSEKIECEECGLSFWV